MKLIVIFSLVVLFSSLNANSAEVIKRSNDKKDNLAVMLTYRPNSEIRTRDKVTNKSWTYKLNEEDSDEGINQQLLDALIKEKFAKRYRPDLDKRTVKRENPSDDEFDEDSSDQVDDAKIVEVENGNDKKTCYKSTYKNVLDAFESALKSQIDNYKKCVCQKKSTTTTTTTTSTTPSPESSEFNARALVSTEEDHDEEDEEKEHKILNDNNENELKAAINHKDDIVCFHRQYAFMLTKLLDRIPCDAAKKKQQMNPSMLPEFSRGSKKRHERQQHINEDNSMEEDIATVKQSAKTAKKSVKLNKTKTDTDKLNEQILAVLKEHLGLKKNEKSIVKKSSKKQISPKKITIKTKEFKKDNEEDFDDEDDFENDFSQKQFLDKLKEVFNKYQSKTDDTFPMQSGEHSDESTSSMPVQKSVQKSTVKRTVSESSDESTEASFRIKNRKAEKERHQVKENIRKTSTTSSASSKRNNSHSKKKSYRNSPRNDDERSSSIETEDVRRNHNFNSKKSKHSRSSYDDRSANDFAKKISDFARSNSVKKA
ncbi:CLUMA_CG004775, isoform A [Clunio marinus]|uniref:CLUMA_CG004775, isoform A n=1 Tax=Clunio marinus TaxID=568069 RepID=A0A1J1HSQ3_9DIPT|nr:CLUMA_CG004775, isoform A [Clunio marinus]